MLDADGRALAGDLLGLMGRGAGAPLSDAAFDAHAARIFAYQFSRNAAYAAFCTRRSRTPAAVSRAAEIPAVPTAAFKELRLATVPPTQDEAVFRTSGTTRGPERRGVHAVPDLRLYRASLSASFAYFVTPPPDALLLSLVPSFADAPDSSLSFMADALLAVAGEANAHGFANAAGRLDTAGLEERIEAAVAEHRPVCLLGTVAALVHWLDDAEVRGVRFTLPPDSRVVDTGGYKGRGRDVAEPELAALYARMLGLPARARVNEYGMTELLSQYYDDVAAAGAGAARVKRGPPWLRATVVDAETLTPLAPGETGLLRHLDLANIGSVIAVQTEDLAVARDEGGFVLLGRAPGATPRGCSIAMDDLLRSSGRA